MTERTYYQNKPDTIKAGLAFSKANPNLYVIALRWGFDQAYVTGNKRLNIFAPSDAMFGIYWLNGKQKKFTEKQIIADQNATPQMY